MKRGFTLVELSIVLVIIGLLIGGILAAQSMISTAKINAVAMQIGQFDAGVENFKTKYNYLPGDAPAFGGDGDGAITISAASGYQGTVDAYTCEIANFWNNIDPTTYAGSVCGIACGVPGAQPTPNNPGKNVPLSKLGANNSYFVAVALSAGGSNAMTPTQNFYGILNAPVVHPDCWRLGTTTSTNSAVKVQDLFALDTKIDDGIPNSGNVLSGSVSNMGSGHGALVGTPITNYCSLGNSYSTYISHTNYECTPIIRIGASTGDPQ